MSNVTSEEFTKTIANLRQCILEGNESINEKINSLEERVNSIEIDRSSQINNQAQGSAQNLRSHNSVASKDISECDDVKAAFNAIKDSVSRIILEPELKLHYSAQGIKAEQRPTYDVVTKAAQYPETILKILSGLKPGETITEDLLLKLFVVQEAQIKWLQDEIGNLVVASDFGANSRTTRWFRLFNKNSSVLSPQQVTHLTSASQIAALPPEQGRNRQRDRFRGQQTFNNRGRNQRGRGGRGRDFYYSQIEQQDMSSPPTSAGYNP